MRRKVSFMPTKAWTRVRSSRHLPRFSGCVSYFAVRFSLFSPPMGRTKDDRPPSGSQPPLVYERRPVLESQREVDHIRCQERYRKTARKPTPSGVG